MTVVAVLALLIALGALALAGWLWQQSRTRPVAEVDDDVPVDVTALRQEVAALRLDLGGILRHLAVVRYDAFPDAGGRLSWSLALLDDHADGVVLTAIHGRSDTRTYAKSITAGACEQPLSPEESDAVEKARG